MNHDELIDTLTQSFSRQVEWYRDLDGIAQKILSQLIMSRNDLSGIVPLFEKKAALVEALSSERSRINQSIELWLHEKSVIADSEPKRALSALFTMAQQSIKTFLNSEEQIRQRLEFIQKQAVQQAPSHDTER